MTGREGELGRHAHGVAVGRTVGPPEDTGTEQAEVWDLEVSGGVKNERKDEEAVGYGLPRRCARSNRRACFCVAHCFCALLGVLAFSTRLAVSPPVVVMSLAFAVDPGTHWRCDKQGNVTDKGLVPLPPCDWVSR